MSLVVIGSRKMMSTPCEATAVCLLTHTKKTDVVTRLHMYTDYMCHLLNGRIRQIELGDPNAADAYFFEPSMGNTPCDLVVFGEPDRTLVKRLLVRYDKPRFVHTLATSLLVAREPRHPIQKILLLIRAEESDETAVMWASRLAQNNDIQVTCLPIIPAQPGLYRYDAPVAPKPNVLLAEGTQTGYYINKYLRHLDQENIGYSLSLQPGDPHTQIKQAVAEEEYDLVIIAAEPHGRLQRLLLGELVSPLLHWLDRPILIAKPTEGL